MYYCTVFEYNDVKNLQAIEIIQKPPSAPLNFTSLARGKLPYQISVCYSEMFLYAQLYLMYNIRVIYTYKDIKYVEYHIYVDLYFRYMMYIHTTCAHVLCVYIYRTIQI